MISMQRESTEYIYIGITGDQPADDQEVAFLSAGVRPSSSDWVSAVLVGDDTSPLWDDASSAGITGDYFIARLVGAFGTNDVVLNPGDYTVWIRLTDAVEQPVRIAPIALTIV